MAQDISQVRHEVEAARKEVGDAVEALVYKLNAPKRIKERVATTVRTAKERTTARAGEVKKQTIAKATEAKDQVHARMADSNGHDDAADVAGAAPPPAGATATATPKERVP